MTEQLSTQHEGLRTVAAGLLAAFEGLGAEHQVLTAEERETTATERRGTVRRMIQSIGEATRTLVRATDLVATVHGMRSLGINKQMTKGASGSAYSTLGTLGDPDEMLYETAAYVHIVLKRLDEAYKPTKKYPTLATARRPQEMRTVLSNLRTALTALRAELIARDLAEEAAEFEPGIAFIGQLEDQVCPLVPAQASGPTADEVAAAILANPTIARAAAAALERTNT